tara:strand:+ start:477 stop:1370 length:894 start_codon:yes stop_codon:yes gene_type:complete
MNKYLIFRTDRIGDFHLSLILIKSIKRIDPSCSITIVSSNKNYEYIKSFKIVDEVILLKKGLINKLKTFIKINKNFYRAIIIHDSKNRSKLISYFLRSKFKYYVNKITKNSYIDEIKEILFSLNFDFIESDLNTLEYRSAHNPNIFKDNYVVFHYDEKWIFNNYIKTYINIEPNKDELIEFLNKLTLKTNKKLIVTTGSNTPQLLTDIFDKDFNPNIKLIDSLNFLHLENIIIQSSLLIACHGSVSHIAAAKNIKQIDIIDKSYNYGLWTAHFRNYQSLNRSKFNILSKNIINLLNS